MEKTSEGNLPFLDCIISLNEKREMIAKVYGKPAHSGQCTHFSLNQPLHLNLSTIKALVRRVKFICRNQTSLNVINKIIKDTLKIHNSEHKSQELEPLKMFNPYQKDVAEKLKRVASKYGFTTVFTKTKDFRGQIRPKQDDKMETSEVVYEVDYNNFLKIIQVKEAQN